LIISGEIFKLKKKGVDIMAISAYALVRISPNKVQNVAADAEKIPGVKNVHAVT
jgi:hypothetical protein